MTEKKLSPDPIDDFIAEQGLPSAYREHIECWFAPLAQNLRRLALEHKTPARIGICGAQGSGKTTLQALLKQLLASEGLRVASLSIDDFYLRRECRLELAAAVHPLLATRGVPGSHELELLEETLEKLSMAKKGDSIELPIFDKALDDRVQAKTWRHGRPDLILLEGWFVGLAPQGADELAVPVNSLEAEEDADGDWRRWVNARLGEYHQRIFAKLDRLVFLRVPDFASVYRWRGRQEEKLRERTAGAESATMDETRLRRFIEHYERLTHHALATLPDQADWMFVLDQSHRIVARVDRWADQAPSAESKPRHDR